MRQVAVLMTLIPLVRTLLLIFIEEENAGEGVYRPWDIHPAIFLEWLEEARTSGRFEDEQFALELCQRSDSSRDMLQQLLIAVENRSGFFNFAYEHWPLVTLSEELPAGLSSACVMATARLENGQTWLYRYRLSDLLHMLRTQTSLAKQECENGAMSKKLLTAIQDSMHIEDSIMAGTSTCGELGYILRTLSSYLSSRFDKPLREPDYQSAKQIGISQAALQVSAPVVRKLRAAVMAIYGSAEQLSSQEADLREELQTAATVLAALVDALFGQEGFDESDVSS